MAILPAISSLFFSLYLSIAIVGFLQDNRNRTSLTISVISLLLAVLHLICLLVQYLDRQALLSLAFRIGTVDSVLILSLSVLVILNLSTGGDRRKRLRALLFVMCTGFAVYFALSESWGEIYRRSGRQVYAIKPVLSARLYMLFAAAMSLWYSALVAIWYYPGTIQTREGRGVRHLGRLRDGPAAFSGLHGIVRDSDP